MREKEFQKQAEDFCVALAECYRLTGAEPSGVDAMDAEYAVREVARMRKELDFYGDLSLALEEFIKDWSERERVAEAGWL